MFIRLATEALFIARKIGLAFKATAYSSAIPHARVNKTKDDSLALTQGKKVEGSKFH